MVGFDINGLIVVSDRPLLSRFWYLQLTKNSHSSKLDNFSMSRDGCAPTIEWIFPDGMFTSFSYQLTTLLTEITQQISTLHEAIKVGTIWTWVDAENIR